MFQNMERLMRNRSADAKVPARRVLYRRQNVSGIALPRNIAGAAAENRRLSIIRR
jgi:hypothetical protein